MLSKLGTKKVAGVVLIGATLIVGLGVVSNFSGGSQKAANEAALSRFGSSAYNSSVGGNSASRADLERQMLATQGGYSARFLKGGSDGTEADEAFSSDGAYAEGIRSAGSMSGYGSDGEGGTYQAFDSTYEHPTDIQGYGIDDQGAGHGERQFQDVASAAAAAAGGGVRGKDGKGADSAKGKSGQIRPATQLNRLSNSKGGSSVGGAGGMGSGAGGGIRSYGADGGVIGGSDSNTQALPKVATGQSAGSDAFRFGRLGGMGGFDNLGPKGSEYRGGASRSNGATADLQLAVAYSGKAVVSPQDVNQKAYAEAAFDGSNPGDLTTTIPDGASIDRVASSLMTGMPDISDELKNTMNDLDKELQNTAQLAQELANLQKKLTILQWATVIGALVFSIAISLLRNIPVYGWIIAAVVTALAAVLLVGMGLWMYDVIDQMQDEKFKAVNQGVDIVGKQFTTGKLLLMSGILVGLGWTGMWANMWNSITSLFSSSAGTAAGGAAAAEGAASTASTGIGGSLKTAAIQAFFSNLFPKRGG